jgi:hypothetical protein
LGKQDPLRADAPVQTDPPGDRLDVGTDLLAEVRDLVDEGNLGGEEGVAGVLGQLRRGDVREHEGSLVQVERVIQILQDRQRRVVVRADHDPVRPQKVLDRRSFAQELGIRGNAESHVFTRAVDFCLDQIANAVRSPDGDRALGDDHLVPVHVLANLACDLLHGREIGPPVRSGRRLDGDEDHQGRSHRLRGVGGEGEAFLLHVPLDQGLQSRFEDRDLPASENPDLARVLVRADHANTELGEAGPGDQPHVAGSDYADVHSSGSPSSCFRK